MHAFDPRRGLDTYRRIRRGGNLGASPPALLAMGFLGLIAVGTLLLLVPYAGKAHALSFFQALFTATAAVTVTGLAIVEPQQLSVYGQMVVICLVQIGGLGFVTFAVVSAITLGNRMSLRQQSLALEAFNQTSTARLRNTAISVLKITVAIEATAMVLLFIWWWRSGRLEAYPALYHAFFHAVAAFNNSGYALFAGSLSSFVNDTITIAILSTVVILGGIGFPIIVDVIQKRRWRRLQTYVRLMIISVIIINLVGFVGIWLLELRNPLTLGALDWPDQARAAWMQAVSMRTAGFTTFDMQSMDDSTALLTAILMFIGGGSMSTAGGIKLGTFVVIMAAVFAYVTQKKEVTIMGRSLSPDVVQKSLAIVVVTVITAVFALLLITILEDIPFVLLLYEVMAALSTAGITLAITPLLSTPSQCVLLVLMFMGRVGPLTLVYSLATRTRSRVRYPEMDFQVG